MREENERLRAEAARLRAVLTQATDQSGSGAAATAGAGPLASSPAAGPAGAALPLQLQATSSGSLPDLLAPPLGRHMAPGLPVAASVGGSGGAFRPTATARPLSAATLADLPRSGSGSLGLGPGPAAAAGGASGAALPGVPPRQVHAALSLYYRDLQAFATSVRLERVPADGEGPAQPCPAPAAAVRLPLSRCWCGLHVEAQRRCRTRWQLQTLPPSQAAPYHTCSPRIAQARAFRWRPPPS